MSGVGLVDTHAHLYLGAFDADRDAVLARARAAGVARILMPPTDAASLDAALALVDAHPGVLWAMAGIHPCEVGEAFPRDLPAVEAALADPRVVAVGETGLDYYWSLDHVDAQHASLRAHARLAMEADLPLVLHSRDRGDGQCARDLVRLLADEKEAHAHGDRLRGVFHCFGGPADLAADVLALGFHLGLGGTATYKNAGVLDAVADVPLARIVLETDAPYLAPVPHRGQRNEPAHVALVAARLAEARGLTVDEVARATTATADALFSRSAVRPVQTGPAGA